MPANFEFNYHISSSGDSKKEQLPEEPSIQFIRAVDAKNLSIDDNSEFLNFLTGMQKWANQLDEEACDPSACAKTTFLLLWILLTFIVLLDTLMSLFLYQVAALHQKLGQCVDG